MIVARSSTLEAVFLGAMAQQNWREGGHRTRRRRRASTCLVWILICVPLLALLDHRPSFLTFTAPHHSDGRPARRRGRAWPIVVGSQVSSLSAEATSQRLRCRRSRVSLGASRGQVEVLYDGLCRVCLANKAFLESQDKKQALRFVNIASEDYDSSAHAGVEFVDAMDEFHIILPSGRVLRGTTAVLQAYEAVGLAWVVGVLGSPSLRWLTDRFYKFISQYRDAFGRLPGGEALRERLRGARFLQKGVAEGEGCGGSDGDENEDEEDCSIPEEDMLGPEAP